MANERQQQVTRTRRSRRSNGQAQDNGHSGEQYAASQTQLAEIDDIISDIVSPAAGSDSVVMGDDQAHGVNEISSEELVRGFRQQSGQ